jgi:hypothetical protein
LPAENIPDREPEPGRRTMTVVGRAGRWRCAPQRKTAMTSAGNDKALAELRRAALLLALGVVRDMGLLSRADYCPMIDGIMPGVTGRFALCDATRRAA